MSVTATSRTFWTEFPPLSYMDRNGKKIIIKNATAKIVLLAIADNADDFGENSYQSFNTLAKKASIDRRSVIRVVRALVASGFLHLAGVSVYGTNNYSVVMEKLGEAPRKRAKIGRPKTSDSEAKTSDSEAKTSDPEAKTSDPESPESSLNPPMIPFEREAPALDFESMTIPEARSIPTLKLYARATDFFPGSVVWEYVHNTISQNNLTFEKIHAASVEWAARGYKRENVKGILEWAINGVPTSNGSRTSQGAKPAINDEAVQATRELIENKYSGNYVPRPEGLHPNFQIKKLAQQKGVKI